jgi:hypothetical protein
MSASVYARGRPVYGGGSYAPNQGHVSASGAQGYAQREQRKQNQGPFGGVSRVGNDGKSDTRSGVAAKALASRVGSGPYNPNGGNTNTDTSTSPTSNPGGASSNPSNPASPASPAAPAAPAPPPPRVVVGPTGQLQLPYDQQFSSEILSALDQYNNELLGLQAGEQSENLDYTRQRRDTETGYTDVKRATLSGNAARGTAYSSQYGTAVGNNARAYQTKINDLDAGHNNFMQNSELRRAGIQSAFQRMLAQAALGYGNDLDDDAGGLGYGTDAPASDSYNAPTSPYNAGGHNLNIPVNWSGGGWGAPQNSYQAGGHNLNIPANWSGGGWGKPKKKKRKKP